MINLFVQALLLSAALHFVFDTAKVLARPALNKPSSLQATTKKVLKINWKPISVFPEEAKRFH